MSLSRPFAALLGAGALGIALVGVGASAQFTTSTSSSQKITAGTLGMSVWSTQATNGCTDATKHCASLTWPNVGPTGSTFESPQYIVHVTNTGNIPATFDAFQLSVPTPAGGSASAYLLAETNVCLSSADSPTTSNHGSWVEGNGPLATAIALHPSVSENGIVVQPGDSVTYAAIFYAGQDTATPEARTSTWPNPLSGCGTVTSDGPNTASAWTNNGAHPYVTPPSLTNAAQGGSITPTVTFSFTG